MDDYNFWSDLLDTWQSTADWIKALIVLTPQATALAALALVLRHRRARRRAEPLPAGTLAYTIWRDDDDCLHLVRYDAEPAHALVLPPWRSHGGGEPPKAVEGADTGEAAASVGPLHHAAHGPPRPLRGGGSHAT